MFKSLTIKNLSLFITIACVAVISLVCIFIFSSSLGKTDYFILAVIAIGFAVLIYILVLYLLKIFVVEKIGLIYNYIHETRLKNPQPDRKELIVTSIEDVKSDVIKWAEDTEKQIQTLRSLEEYRKNFVGNVSHELKTPIFSIQGYLHTLLEGGLYDENINLKYIERAAQNADRLQNIVEDLEGIAKLESGKLELSLSKFNIYSLVNDVFMDLKGSAAESNIEFGFVAGTSTTLMVEADKDMIRQVLINLITNSIKYGKEDGRTEIAFYDMGKNVLIEVSDNGIGIESKHINHLFDRFYRVDPSRSRILGGSGLGLSIVKHIIEAHQQTIKATSSLGEGSKFSFTLNKV